MFGSFFVLWGSFYCCRCCSGYTAFIIIVAFLAKPLCSYNSLHVLYGELRQDYSNYFLCISCGRVQLLSKRRRESGTTLVLVLCDTDTNLALLLFCKTGGECVTPLSHLTLVSLIVLLQDNVHYTRERSVWVLQHTYYIYTVALLARTL